MMGRNLEYYESRLSYIIELFKSHESKILAENKNKIQKLMEEYRMLDNYNLSLIKLVEFVI